MENKGFQVLDFEALNWNKLYAIGIYDGVNYRYIAEKNKDNSYFVKWLLDNLEPDKVCYAHNGGKYDFIFLFQFCESINNKPYGIKLIHGSIAEFRIKYNNKRYIFRDSLHILPASLKNLTVDFDVEHKKLKMDYDIGIDDERFEDYFKNDILGLYEVLEKSNLTNHLTIASGALDSFRKNFYTLPMERNDDDVEHLFREGYKGGRTEIFKLYGKNLKYYDVNSLYPSVMYDFEYPLPIKNNFKKVYSFDKDKLGIYDIVAQIDDLKIPVLHKNVNGKFIFPVGTVNGLFYTPEINKAVEMGYKVKVNYGYEFIKTDFLFKKYVEHYYTIKKSSKGSQRAIAKLMLNSLYGKFGQRRNREVVELDYEEGVWSNMNFNLKKYWDSTSSFIHPEIAGLVTANARVRLYELFQKAGLDNIYYCDTDSIFTDKELKTSDKLGDIKLEGNIKEFIAIAPKLYSYIDADNELEVKAKGFKTAKFTFDDFKLGLNGNLEKFVEQRDKLASFKERFKRNSMNNFGELLNVNKHLRGFYDKRKVIENYDTVPLRI